MNPAVQIYAVIPYRSFYFTETRKWQYIMVYQFEFYTSTGANATYRLDI